MKILGGFGWSACTRGWAVLDGLRSKELSEINSYQIPSQLSQMTHHAHWRDVSLGHFAS